MQSDELLQRLKAVPGLDPGIDVGAFDAENPLQVDELARGLLQRFYGEDDGQAFTLLVEATTPLLARIARGLIEELSLAIAPTELIARYMSGLFVDLRTRRVEEERFLAAAERSMRGLCMAQIEAASDKGRRLLASKAKAGPPGGAAPVGGTVSGTVDGQAVALLAGPGARPLVPVPRLAATGHVAADAELARVLSLGMSFLTVVQASFHGLTETDRRLLLASEVRDLSYDQIAEELSIPESQIGPLLRDARERFSRRVADAFQRPSGQGGQS